MSVTVFAIAPFAFAFRLATVSTRPVASGWRLTRTVQIQLLRARSVSVGDPFIVDDNGDKTAVNERTNGDQSSETTTTKDRTSISIQLDRENIINSSKVTSLPHHHAFHRRDVSAAAAHKAR